MKCRPRKTAFGGCAHVLSNLALPSPGAWRSGKTSPRTHFRVPPPRGSVAALVASGSSVRSAEDSNLPPTAREFWLRGKPTTCRIIGAVPYKCAYGTCTYETTAKMSWCPGCGRHRPDSWACSTCQMVSMGIDDYCRFRISGGCPGVLKDGRPANDDKHGPDALRAKLMKEARKAAGAKDKVQQLGAEHFHL